MNFMLYSHLNNNIIINNIRQLCTHYTQEKYEETISRLLEENIYNKLDGQLFKAYLCSLISYDENPLSLLAEKQGKSIDKNLYKLALKDMEEILRLFQCTVPFIEMGITSDPIYLFLESKPQKEQLLDYLLEHYYKHGAGIMGRYKAFKWDKNEGLYGIENCDPIKLGELFDYDSQKELLRKNTVSFLENKPCNNVLLFGDRGTGKSSSVKALLNEYHQRGLRLIELHKTDFVDFNKLLQCIRNRGLKFILFLDDLSFEEFEIEYKYMKAVIEGAVEIKSDNVLIYATSNRRHLIRETWGDRSGEDVHVKDTREEKLSLSDRFGLTITYTSPNQEEYLNIVTQLAKKHNIDLPLHIIRENALKWSLLHAGKSGRVAKQFIASLMQ